MRTIALLSMILFSASVSANVITLYCEGVTRGPDIADSPSTRVIELDTTTKKIMKVSPSPTACFLGKLESIDTRLYEATTDFFCLSDIAESYLKLSRYNFTLEEITRFIGEKHNGRALFWVGKFSCSERQKRF
jgi:hypothetical protein